MEKQFFSQHLEGLVENLKNSNCNGFQFVPHGDMLITQFFCGELRLAAALYQTQDQAFSDVELLREVIPALAPLRFPFPGMQPVESPAAANGVTLPAGAKLDTETPTSVKNLQLETDLEGLTGAQLTAYEIGVTPDGKYRLSLYRSNTIAFEYLYNSNEDRGNDMAVVLDRMPKLQHIGGPEFVS